MADRIGGARPHDPRTRRPAGVRDRGAIDSAPAPPVHRSLYGVSPDAAEFAAADFFALARNHGFVDGIERVAWIVVRIFLADNGRHLVVEPKDAIRIVQQVAAGDTGWRRSDREPEMRSSNT